MTPAFTAHYVYDLNGRLIAEANSAGQTTREYIWIDNLPLAVVADVDTMSPQLWFVHADHLDRPIKMTNGAQATVWDAVYRPFGDAVSITGAASNNLRFPGQYFLIESGLHYNWHRHYDPTTGRYLQPDPLGFIDGPSIYAYAMSAPTLETDPQGLQRGTPWRPWGPYSPYNVRQNIRGPYSNYENVTGRGANVPNIRTNVCRADFEQNLIASGYQQSLTNPGSTYPRYELGGKSYQFYRSKSTGEPTVFFNPGYGPGIEIRIPTPK